jgi:hypothetical protein
VSDLVADAPGHLLGQLIGGLLETATEPPLRELVARHKLYLDVKGERPGVRAGKLLSLPDGDGNKHDLDFVIERPGTDGEGGHYAAFIECAWRRYTKHSKAKAQEIQGAVLPLVQKWAEVGPVPAVVVAGQWSRPSIKQLESAGFVVLELDFQTTLETFAKFGIDIKGRDKVADQFWQEQVDRLRHLSNDELDALAATLRKDHLEDFESFIAELEKRIVRTVEIVRFYPIHGKSFEFASLDEAINGLHQYDPDADHHPLIHFEFEIIYTNGDAIRGKYTSVHSAEEFLRRLA